MIPLLSLLGYELHYNRQQYTVGNLTFPISHRAGEKEDEPPVHIVGIKQELGRLSPGGRPRLSPHSLVQEFLNRTEALWGLVTNGKIIRLLRDSTYIRRQCYVEFDLEAIFEQHLFQDFAVLYRLLHRSRLPRSGTDVHQCLLEQYYRHSVEQGGRVRDLLRDGVEECIKRMANGFLSHPKNDELRTRIRADVNDNQRLSPEELYRQLLRLVYRFLFMLVSEDRGLISQNPIYVEHYSVSRLRRLVDLRAAYTEHDDIWHSLRVLWKLLSDDTPVQQIGGKPLATLLDLPVLNGELFEPLFLDSCLITNRDLLKSLRSLVNYRENHSSSPRRVNYAALDVEELGSVYESLLDYHPLIDTSGSFPRFEFASGSERKSTGSYYTPAELVAELIKSALEPVIEKRLEKAREMANREWQKVPEKIQETFAREIAKGLPQSALSKEWQQTSFNIRYFLCAEQALLSIKVIDPACGSGHFLLAAARRLGRELARIRTGEDEPAPERVREAIRDVVAHCIYGVDKNPLAVELCRLALWIESHTSGKPLSFLDHRIRCGDSLVGVFDLKVLEQGIPDEAFNAVSGDDKQLATILKRENREERTGQLKILAACNPITTIQNLVADALALDSISDDSPEAIRRKKKLYDELQKKSDQARTACDLWTAAFFQPKNDKIPRDALITTDTLRRYIESGTAHPQAVAHAVTLSHENRFFHWPLEFPEVFAQNGFDVVIGNSPFNAKLGHASQKFMKTIYEDSGSINTAILFWLRAKQLIKVGGIIGLVTPKSITYFTRWSKIRSVLSSYLEELTDCGQAWRNVLLEQVLVVVKKDTPTEEVKTKRLYLMQHKSTYVRKEILDTFDVWFINPESSLMEILQSIQKSPNEWISLGKILVTYRGGNFQKFINNDGVFPVIGGKDISPFAIKSFSGFLTSQQIDNLALFKAPKAVFQNIVAYVSRPTHHIKIIGAVDYDGVICLDTVNIVKCPTGILSPEAIVGLLSSNLVNWFAHRVTFGFAQRTMHLDQFVLNRIFIPISLLEEKDKLDTLAKSLVYSKGRNKEAFIEIENIIQEAYKIGPKLRKELINFLGFPLRS